MDELGSRWKKKPPPKWWYNRHFDKASGSQKYRIGFELSWGNKVCQRFWDQIAEQRYHGGYCPWPYQGLQFEHKRNHSQGKTSLMSKSVNETLNTKFNIDGGDDEGRREGKRKLQHGMWSWCSTCHVCCCLFPTFTLLFPSYLHCYDFRWLSNRWQSKAKGSFRVQVQMSLEECKSNDLYCLTRFESGLSSRE